MEIDLNTTRLLQEIDRHQYQAASALLRRDADSNYGMPTSLDDIQNQRRFIDIMVDQNKYLGSADSFFTGVDQRAAYHEYENNFRLPTSHEAALLALAASRNDVPDHSFSLPSSVEASTIKSINAMQHPWLHNNNFDQSAKSFSDIQLMGEMLKAYRPYDDILCGALRHNLGDWRDSINYNSKLFDDLGLRSHFYFEQGLNPSLTEFPAAAFDEILERAGLAEAVSDDASADESDEEGYARARAAFSDLQSFEVEIRTFIENKMVATFGQKWIKHKTPEGMAKKWEEKRDRAAQTSTNSTTLISYADFTDYIAIICRKDNWDGVFAPIFRRKESIQESFQRLFPVRIATMHARTISLDDKLYLIVEIGRIRRAIRDD